jgi:hypothetical protein
MTTRHERAQREADPSGVSLVGFSVWPGADAVVIDTVLHDDFVHRFQAHQQEQARGPGYYVGLLRALASDRAAMAQRLRTGNEAT